MKWERNELLMWLLDILDTTRVAKVIKQFRFSVSHAQRYIREMLETEKVQLTILTKYY